MSSVSEELRKLETWQACAAEGIATALFVFLGAGAVVTTAWLQPASSMDPARLVAIALAHGLAIALLVAATATVSGGHINPVVTLSALVTRKITVPRGCVYILSQIAGAIAGAALLKAVVPSAAEAAAGNMLGAHALSISTSAGLLTEIILTFALVFVVFATAMDPRGLKRLAPIAIGLIVLVDHLVGVPLTGASMNPARSFGPALLSTAWTDHWVYWVGPSIGGVLAAVVYQTVFLCKRTTEGEDS